MYIFLVRKFEITSFLNNNLSFREHTITDWKNFLRELCVEIYLVNPQPIGGHVHVVEIDENKFGHSNYSRGRMLSGRWIIGGIDRNTKKVFTIPVQDRSAVTLVPLIVKYIFQVLEYILMSGNLTIAFLLQHSIILQVNHSLTFIDPTTGEHTKALKYGQ